MKITIKNDLEILYPNKDILDYCDDKLTITNPDFIIANKLGHYVGAMERAIKLYSINGDSVILPFGCLNYVWSVDKNKSDYNYKIPIATRNNLQGSIKLYPYQQNALNSMLEAKNGILVAPCGSGKTQIGIELISKLHLKALWITHTKKLLKQSLDRTKAYYKGDYGTITEGQVHIGKDITFATVQTLSKIDPMLYKNEFGVVIVDECHHCIGCPTKVMMFYKVLSNINCRYKYGLTATIKHSGLANSMYAILGDVCYVITNEMVGDKIIKANYVPIDTNIKYEKDNYLDTDGTLDFGKMIDTLSNNEDRTKMICENISKNYNEKNKQLILCHRLTHINNIYNILLDKYKIKNEDVSFLYGKLRNEKRNYNAKIIIATYNLAKEGLDIPELNILHLATPIKDKTIVEQCAGRVERNIKGKDKPIIYDYVDNDIEYCLNCFKIRKRILNKK